VARVAAGTSQASSTRYGYVCIALLLPAAALALSRICQRAPVAGRALVAGASAIWVVNGVASLVGVLQFLSPLSGAAQSTTLGAARLLAESAPLAVGNGRASRHGPRPHGERAAFDHPGGRLATNLPVTDQDLLDAARTCR